LPKPTLTRSEDEEPAGDNKAAKKGTSKVLSKLGKVGKLVKTGREATAKIGGDADAVDMTGSLVADHFKPIKSVIAEVDGQPPALDAAVVALTALSYVLQTVTASPDPQDAVKKQGGLAELTGAVARQALVLPDPIDDWLGGIATDTGGLTEKAGNVRAERHLARRHPAFLPGGAYQSLSLQRKRRGRECERLRAAVRSGWADRCLHQRPPDQLCRHDPPNPGHGAPISG
jgi:hypothetical protein